MKTWRRHPFTFAMADASRPKVSGLQALIGTIVLARTLRPHWEGQQNVGLLLPPSVAGALINVAAALSGKTSVNLNYTVGRAGLESAVKIASLKTVLTSRLFVDKAKLDIPQGVTVLWLEDIAKAITAGTKLSAALLAILAPIRLIERSCDQFARRPWTTWRRSFSAAGAPASRKALSQQPDNVRLLAQDLGLAKDATGKDVYSALSNQARDMGIIKGQSAQTTLPGSQSRAATDLRELGIPGIRYLDGGSRPNSGRITMLEQTIANLKNKGASKAAIANTQHELDAELARASYNYVVFPGLEDQVKILERNGIPLSGLLGGQ